MYRLRLHGRGGQGIKTASRILGSAFFAEGFEVQDAPRYGAERRGAPVFAYVRAGHAPIHERGAIARPDLVVVADPSLVPVAAAGVLVGLRPHSVLLLASDEAPETWRERLRLVGPVRTLPRPADEADEPRCLGLRCAAAAARLTGVISWEALETAIRAELDELGPAGVAESLEPARAAFELLAPHAGEAREGPEVEPGELAPPDWVELPFEPASLAAPEIHASANSVEVRTGLWRTLRPVVDLERCHRCHWICSTFCPDGAIRAGAGGEPEIDYDHCKGCLVCVAVCPSHAIRAVPEHADGTEREARA